MFSEGYCFELEKKNGKKREEQEQELEGQKRGKDKRALLMNTGYTILSKFNK